MTGRLGFDLTLTGSGANQLREERFGDSDLWLRQKLGHWFGLRLFWDFFLDLTVAVGNAPAVDFYFLEHPPNVFMAGEHEQLMSLLGKLAEHRASGPGAAGVEIYKDVIEDHRQVDTATAVRRNERETKADEELLARATAKDLHRERLAFRIVDEQDVVGQRGPDARIFAAGQLAHVFRRFTERLGLPILLVLDADTLEKQANGRPLAPGVDRFLDLLFDNVEFDLLDGERLIGGGRALLLDHRAAALQRVLQPAVELVGLRGEGFPIVFEPANLVVGQERRKISFSAVPADGGSNLAGNGGPLLAQVFRFVKLSG